MHDDVDDDGIIQVTDRFAECLELLENVAANGRFVRFLLEKVDDGKEVVESEECVEMREICDDFVEDVLEFGVVGLEGVFCGRCATEDVLEDDVDFTELEKVEIFGDKRLLTVIFEHFLSILLTIRFAAT